MQDRFVAVVSTELNIPAPQVSATAALLDDGGTIPFIARYRKEQTGSLDEVAVTAIRDRLAQLADLEKRRDTILKSLEDQGVLTDELHSRIQQAGSLTVIEDIYLPFRPKRRTRATMARERGLEPLAEQLFAQRNDCDPDAAAAAFVDDEEVATAEAPIRGRCPKLKITQRKAPATAPATARKAILRGPNSGSKPRPMKKIANMLKTKCHGAISPVSCRKA